MIRARLLCLAILVAALAGSSLAVHAQHNPRPRRILVLYSFHKGIPWEELIGQGIRSVLTSASPDDVQINEEYLDRVRYPLPEQTKIINEYLRMKYGSPLPDLILTSGEEASRHLISFGRELFPDVPIVTLTGDSEDFRRPALPSHMTSLLSGEDFAGTLDMALSMLPATKNVYVVAGNSFNDQQMVVRSRPALAQYESRVRVTYLNALPVEDLMGQAASLPANSFILYLNYLRDPSGNSYVSRQVLSRLSAVANAPIFGLYDSHLGFGIVGGRLSSADLTGQAMGRVGQRILLGEHPGDIPPSRLAYTAMFDWRQLSRWSLTNAPLPTEGQVVFREYTFWELYWGWGLLAAAILLVQTALIGLLLTQLRLRAAKEAQRHKAENALRESEKSYRRIVETANEGIWVVDSSLITTFINHKMAKMLGFTPEEMLNKHFDLFLYPEDLQAHRASMVLRQQGKSATYERRYLHKNGTPVWFLVNAAPIIDEEGRVTGSFAMFTDINERKRSELERAKLESQLRQAQKMQAVGTLAGGVAHEFNNLLAAIMGYTELAQQRASGRPGLLVDLSKIITACERARDLVRQLLAFSRKTEPQVRPFNLNAEIRSSREMLERLVPRMHSIETHLEPDLKMVSIAGSHINQVLMNLVGNAAHAMPDGGRITVRTENVSLDGIACSTCGEVFSGEYVLLSVSDTGHGMSEEILQRIWEPFFSTKEVGSGTGLGLSVVQGLVKSYGGHITCQSELGRGSTFSVYLPVCQNESIPVGREQEDDDGILRGTETILLADDEEFLRELGQRALADMGYQVHQASNGEEALESYGRRPDGIDLVILDLGMPGMGGLRCMREILAINPRAKIVIASGYASDTQVRECLTSGASAFVAKPYRLADLLTTVRNVLNQN